MEKKAEPTESKAKIAKEVAEADFGRFVASMRLNLSTEGMDAEDRTQLEQNKRRIIDAALNGSLVFSAEGVPTFTPQDSENREPIVFPQPLGADFMAADFIKKNHDIEKSFSMMAATTHQPLTRFAGMLWSDLRVCQAIANLYMGG